MKRISLLLLLSIFIFSCGESQNNQTASSNLGGPCEGCEAIYEYGTKQLKHIDTLVGFKTLKNPIHISGTVYQQDGKTVAKNVIIYIYHTDNEGIYPSTKTSKGWERRHGYLRGWMKTDDSGKYSFYTSRPASYPNSKNPQHIHITVKEPDKKEYYIDAFYFEDDPYLTSRIKQNTNPRGGSGIITLKNLGSLKVAKRDIILGLNIPNYPN